MQRGLGLIGTGYLAKAFAVGYRAMPVLFGPDAGVPVLELVCTSSLPGAERAAAALGFNRATATSEDVIVDPSVEIVVVNTPNHLHAPMALAAIRAGKHVHCEKPLGLSPAECRSMTLAAEAAGVRTIVGFNYRQNPATALAREIIQSGEIGEAISIRATHNEDFMADPDIPLGWKHRKATAGHGALVDVGSHIVCIAEYLLGPIARVCGRLRTVIETRPVQAGASERGPVETDDEARFLLEFVSGMGGMIEASRIATGRKMQLGYEVYGTRGSLCFDQQRMSELQLYEAKGPTGRRGFKTIPIAAEHPDYGAFGAGPGHGIGFNDQKIIECRRFLEAIATGRPASPDFRAAWQVSEVLEAVARSSESGSWEAVSPI
ncbi:MAG TPA: Gfo/Idh/MocA family oxidoreductase [Geminicoccus sp.]|jgi:predicted dehydrogenase|uniref:Gfo/Idh/MocA family protein n=1 Tax=Geminicoccus sp. TaxID=2024832 RepID=UPI002E301A99|nr:Gfo/Idh/MocA family oxidoreductase [Geminicoccus sp.]HEX2527701.1 Gfo/Idh/MocA family oxidoreductase [Geminicoccus sp.]